MRVLLVTLLLLCIVDNALSCGRRRRGRKRLQGLQGQPICDDVVKCKVGDAVQTSPYSPSGDAPGDCSKLKCNLDEQSSCCWTNAVPQTDQLNFAKGTGAGDPVKMQTFLATGQQPTGNYFITASDNAGTTEQSAQLYSCPITCSQGDITVKVKHWETRGTKLQVCQEKDPAGPPQNCQDLPGGSGGADTVTLPKGENTRVVIQAKGFTTPTGDVAIIDDIEVKCDVCQAATPVPAPTAGPAPEPTPAPANPPCKEINCDFEQSNTCKYQPRGGSAKEGWSSHQAIYQNRLTGIGKPSSNGQNFGACYTQKKGEKATFSTNAKFDKDYVIKYKYYKATQGLSFRCCCNDESNCPKQASKDVQTSDYRAWKQEAIKCPSGTNKFICVCENVEGSSEGACGIDDIQLMQSCDGDPNSCSQKAC